MNTECESYVITHDAGVYGNRYTDRITKSEMDTEYYDEDSQVEHLEETNVFTVLQEISNRLDSIETKFTQRFDAVEKKIEDMVTAFEANVNESINFRHEIKKAFKLTTQKLLESEAIVFKLTLPCDSEKSIVELEKQIGDDKEAYMELRHRILDVGGKDIATFIRRSLETVWTNDTALYFSWSGQRYNIAIKDYKIILIIKDIARARFNTSPEEIDMVDKLIKKWFFYAAQRSSKHSTGAKKEDFVKYRKKVKEELLGKSYSYEEEEEDTIKPDSPAQSSNMDDYNKYEEYIEVDETSYTESPEKPKIIEKPQMKKQTNSFENAFLQDLAKKSQIKLPRPNLPKAVNLPERTKEELSKTIYVNSSDPSTSPKVLVKVTPSVRSAPAEIMKRVMASGTMIKKVQAPSHAKIENKPTVKATVKSDEEFKPELPIKTEEQLNAAEKWLKNESNRHIMSAILQSIKERCSELNIIFNQVFSDNLLRFYSWNGKNDHKSLEVLTLSKLLIEAWKEPNQSVSDFEKNIRVCIYRSHTLRMRREDVSDAKKIKLG